MTETTPLAEQIMRMDERERAELVLRLAALDRAIHADIYEDLADE